MLRNHARFLFLLILLFVVVAPVMAAPDLTVVLTHTGNAGTSGNDFAISSSNGTVSVTVDNTSATDPTAGDIVLHVTLAGGLTFGAKTDETGATFNCTATGSGADCTTSDSIAASASATVTFSVTAPAAAAAGPFTNTVTATGGGIPADVPASDTTAFAIVIHGVDLIFTSLTHIGNSGTNFAVNTSDGRVTFILANQGDTASAGTITVTVFLGGGLSLNTLVTSGQFTCSGTTTVTCQTNGASSISPGTSDTTTFTVNAPNTPNGIFTNNGAVTGGTDVNGANNAVTDSVPFSIIVAGTLTPAPTATLTPFPTFPIPTFTPIGGVITGTPGTIIAPTVFATPTLIPAPATNTPLPRSANAGQAVGPIPHAAVTVVVDRDGVNVRLLPALGAEVIANVNAGFTSDIIARSPDDQWVEILLAGQLGWIGTPVLAVVAGNLDDAPVADPRTIPYGGFENPRAGLTSVTSGLTGKLQTSGLRVRGGPSRAYPVLANAPRYTIFSLLGRTADNLWLQVNFEGTLGWVATQFVDLQQGLGVLGQLPVDGIVADSLPISQPTSDSYNDTLSLMLSRLDLAQPSLDAIRGIWTNIALGQRVQCSNFPAEPTNFNIPNPVLAPFYATLYPLNTDFNSAMTALRHAIDLFIQVCQSRQPTDGLVGQAVVQQALDAINQADALFSSLRARLLALAPGLGPITDDECLFTFNNRSQIVPRLSLNDPKLAHLTAHNFVLGFCFDAGAGQSLKLQALKFTGNAEPRLTVSAFNNPTNFIGSAEISPSLADVSIQPLVITETGRYILILADLDGGPNNTPLDGQIALLLTDVTANSGLGSPSLAIDPATGNLIINQGGSIAPATPNASFILTPGIGTTPGFGGTPTFTPIPTQGAAG